MLDLINSYIVPLMLLCLIIFLLSGFPVAFALAANGVLFGVIGIYLGYFKPEFIQAVPSRIFGIMSNEILLAIPFFTFMGLILERSGMAEDLLNTIGQLFGPIRGGLAYSVIFVGALLAATTGVVAASVISMGLITLPIMMKYGYDKKVASGVIAASGTLAQIIPPSLVLIVLSQQLDVNVGAMYQAAFLPGFLLIALYVLFILLISLIKPAWVPALPLEARQFSQDSERQSFLWGGYFSLLALIALGVLINWGVMTYLGAGYTSLSKPETWIVSASIAVIAIFVLAIVSHRQKWKMISPLAEKFVLVIVPPLALIFLVLGTIGIGLASPTAAGAMGAVGAMILAVLNGRFNWKKTQQALEATARLSSFVMFILIGSTIFVLVFRGLHGDDWIVRLFSNLPGGKIGFLIAVNLIFFVVAFFLDFFELAFILVPIVTPVAQALGIDMVWFGVMLAVNIQTSFLHPPFGFALFYLRSVAPSSIKTSDIYLGAIPFVLIQLLMVGLIVAFPQIISVENQSKKKEDLELNITFPTSDEETIPEPSFNLDGQDNATNLTNHPDAP